MEFVIGVMSRVRYHLICLELFFVIASADARNDFPYDKNMSIDTMPTPTDSSHVKITTDFAEKDIHGDSIMTTNNDNVINKRKPISAPRTSESHNDNVVASGLVMTGSQDDAQMEIKMLDARSKRQINALPLVYPYGGVYRLILGFTTPIHNPDNVNFVLLCSILYQYVQFQNITQLSQYYVYNTISREQRDTEWESRRDERLVLYKAIEEMMNSKGFNGRDCMLRAICEAAQYPVDEDGLVGELMHIILTPNYGRSEFDKPDPDLEASMSAYTSAYTAGRQMFSCPYIYSFCPEGTGLLELITVLRNE